jgi:type II secretory pathway pseudopilin PulG
LELLIVIGIIAILAAAVIIALNPAKHFEQARNSQRWSDISSLSSAVYSYVVSSGGFWPPCVADTTPTTTVDAYVCRDDLVPDYISAIPFDPQVDPNGTTTAYILHLTEENRLKVYVDGENPDVRDDVTGIEIIR